MNIVKARAYFKTRHSGLRAQLPLPRIAFRIRRFWMSSFGAYQNDVSEGLKSGQSPVPYGTGQSLVEVLVSLTVAAAVLSAITVGVIYSLRNTQFSKNQNLASQYAAEGMEIIRQLRDSKSSLSGFLEAENTSKTSCLPQDSTAPVNQPQPPLCGQNVGPKDIGSTNYIYRREVTIDPPSQIPPTECEDNYKVTVKVSWWDNVCGGTNFCHKVNLISCLADRKNNAQRP